MISPLPQRESETRKNKKDARSIFFDGTNFQWMPVEAYPRCMAQTKEAILLKKFDRNQECWGSVPVVLLNFKEIHIPLQVKIAPIEYTTCQVRHVNGTITAEKHPWETDKSQFEVLEEYDAKVVSDEGEYYGIEFYEDDSSVVEARMSKGEFKDLPYKIRPGTEFFIMIYRIKNQPGTMLSVWPVAKYRHSSW